MTWYGPLPFRIPNTLYEPSALFMLCILCVVQVLSDLEMKVEGLREEEGRLRVACQERERQRAALEADTLTSDPLREVERDSLQLCVCVLGGDCGIRGCACVFKCMFGVVYCESVLGLMCYVSVCTHSCTF